MKYAGYFFRSVELIKLWRNFPPLWPVVSRLCLQNSVIASHPKRGSHSVLLICIRFRFISSSHLLLGLHFFLPTDIISNKPPKPDFAVYLVSNCIGSLYSAELVTCDLRDKEEGNVSRCSEVSHCLFERIAVRWETRVPDNMGQWCSWKNMPIVFRRSVILYRLYSLWDRGSTVVKVSCYKSEGRWFDPSWCQWIFHWHKILPIAL